MQLARVCDGRAVWSRGVTHLYRVVVVRQTSVGSLIGTALVAVSLADGGAPRPSD